MAASRPGHFTLRVFRGYLPAMSLLSPRLLSALLMVSVAFAGANAFAEPANMENAPPNFPYRDGDAVFVDFERADYHLVYDFAAKTVTVESEITFNAPVGGYPIFDLVPDPRDVRLDDRAADVAQVADPDDASYLRIVGTKVAPGAHRLTMAHSLATNVEFRPNGVASAFWMTDLTDRHYLEQYLPSNLQFNQYPKTMRIEITGAQGMPHLVRANGTIRNPSENVFEVKFPAYYSNASVFFHLTTVDAIPTTKFNYPSVDGRALPVEVYVVGNATLMAQYVANTKAALADLEKDYGPFPHPKVIVYGNGPGGMEYAGATVSSPYALGHELFHSYNARGVMPADGNSGWMDEAMSSWHDRHYALRTTPGAPTKMAGHSAYFRITDGDAYGKGTDFLAWIANRMDAEGKDFKGFLREYYRANMYHTDTTETLRRAMEIYSGLDLAKDFEVYVYGTLAAETTPKNSKWARASLATCGSFSEVEKDERAMENPFHPRLTAESLRKLL
jgi:hypothetical protein